MNKPMKILSQQDKDDIIKKRERIEEILQNNYAFDDIPMEMEAEIDNYDKHPLEIETEELIEESIEYSRVINEDNYKILFNQYSQEYNNVKQGQYLGDFNGENDLLNRKSKAELIANMLVYNSPKSHFNIGVLGKWGSGKTTFLNLIEKELKSIELKNEKDITKINLIKIDASEYEETDKIWYNILKQIFKKYEEENKWNAKVVYKIKTTKINYICIIIRIFSAVLLLTGMWLLGDSLFLETKSTISSIIGAGGGLSLIIIGIINAIIPIGKEILKLSTPLSESITSFIELPNFDKNLGERESVKIHLENLVKVWINKKNEKIVLFIDEIDRCSNRGVVEFFKAMQILTNIPNINVVYSINHEYLIKVLEDCGYKTYQERQQFIDKYMLFSIMLDTKTQTIEYIESLVENTLFSIKEKEIIYRVFQKLQNYDITPREKKKIVNLLVLSKQYAKIYSIKHNINIVFDKFIVWCIISYLFPTDTDELISKMRTKNKFDKVSDCYFVKTEKDKIQNILRYKLKDELDDLVIQNVVEFNKLAKEIIVTM